MPEEQARRLEVGRIGRPHGLRGEVTVMMVTDRAERTAPGAVLHGDGRVLVIEAVRPHRQGWIIHFEGVDDVGAAESLRGTKLTADAIDDADAVWVHDLVGCAVVDRAGQALGEVVSVEANPAHDLLVLDGGGLVPMPFVVDHSPGRVVVDLPDGLLEV